MFSVTNDRFAALMDLGKMDVILRAGAFWKMVWQRWTPVLVYSDIQFGEALRLLESYHLRSRLLCWRGRFFWFEHRFERDGSVVATGITKSAMLGKNGLVPAEDIIEATHEPVSSPSAPPIVKRLRKVEERRRKRRAEINREMAAQSDGCR